MATANVSKVRFTGEVHQDFHHLTPKQLRRVPADVRHLSLSHLCWLVVWHHNGHKEQVSLGDAAIDDWDDVDSRETYRNITVHYSVAVWRGAEGTPLGDAAKAFLDDVGKDFRSALPTLPDPIRLEANP